MELVKVLISGKIKKEASLVLEAMGLTMGDAIRLLLTKIAREQAFPFDPLIYKDTSNAVIEEARARNLPRVRSIKKLKRTPGAND